MTLREYIRLWVHHRIVLLVCAVLGALGGYSFAAVSEPTYVSTSSVLVTVRGLDVTAGALQQSDEVARQRAATIASIATSGTVLERAATAAGTDADTLARAIVVTPRVAQSYLDVTATANEAQLARTWSQAVAESLSSYGQGVVGSPLDSTVGVTVVTAAPLPEVAVSPRPANNAAIGFIVGVVLGLSGVALWNAFDGRLRRLSDLAPLRFRGPRQVIPRVGRRDSARRTERIRLLRAQLEVSGGPAQTVFLVDVDGAERKGGSRAGELAVDLAQEIAELGKSVLVIDFSGASGTAQEALALERRPETRVIGVDDLFSTPTSAVEGVSPVTYLRVGGNGTATRAGAGATSLRAFLEPATARFDALVLTASPLDRSADSLIIAAVADATVLVAEVGKSRKSSVASAVTILADASVDGRSRFALVGRER